MTIGDRWADLNRVAELQRRRLGLPGPVTEGRLAVLLAFVAYTLFILLLAATSTWWWAFMFGYLLFLPAVALVSRR